ncbi:hypothetical protein GCM10028777_37700 [Angustibacter speluncae]
MRVFLPGTGPLLSQWVSAGEVVVELTAHAVTPALREWYTEGDAEELEYAAMVEAAEASLRLLGDDPSAPRRRVVLAADVDVAITLPDGDAGPRSQVLLPGPVAWSDVVSIHVDEEDAATDVAAAVEAVEAADAGDDDAQFVVDGAEGHDLLWFDVTETSLVLTDLEVG